MVRGGTEKQLIVCFFDDVRAGRAAARAARTAGAHPRNIGVLSRGVDDEIDVSQLDRSPRPTAEGLGAVLKVIATAVVGGVMPKREHFFDVRSDLSTDDVIRLAVELDTGHAAVLVLGDRLQTERVIVRLTQLGGKAELHAITGHALELAAKKAWPRWSTETCS